VSKFVVEELLPAKSTVRVETDPDKAFYAKPTVQRELSDGNRSVAAIYEKLAAEGAKLEPNDKHILIGQAALPPPGSGKSERH
jgi:hypothetical protein